MGWIKRGRLWGFIAVSCAWSLAAWAAQPGGPQYELQPLLVQADISVDEMPPAMAEAFVRGIQEELAEHGYDPGPADGIQGARTAAAIRAYQRDAQLPVNGVASKGLLDHLKFVQPRVVRAAAPAAPPAALVTNVQLELARRGFYRGTIDGISGPRTLDAVRTFQSAAGLPVTGTLDERLLAELRSTDPNIRARDL
jgi:peptidoglycan hydrolase-like protein with peptidoglycan-binding domain